MRAVTFSDAELARELESRFLCAWVNVRPEETFEGVPLLPESRFRSLPIGAGVTNVTSIFALADGTVLNAVPGHLDAPRFLEEMRLALEVDRWGFESYTVLHSERARTLRPEKPRSRQKGRPPVGALWSLIGAHVKLAEAGLLHLDTLQPGWFEDIVPRIKLTCLAGPSDR